MSKMRKELTDEEKAISYSKYYYQEMAEPNQTVIDRVNKGPIDAKDALRFEDINDLMEPGYLASESGFCILPDGAGYISSLQKMPGVTLEMVDWWFAWHGLHPLRYRIWDPYDHFDLQVGDADRSRLKDQTIPLRERIWGVTHYASEDVGIPAPMILLRKLKGIDPFAIKINFLSPEEIGFDMQRLKAANATVICTNAMCHYFREIGDGVELRTRFWLGYALKDKKPVRDPTITFPVPVMKALNLHSAVEYPNLARILPLVYSEEKDNW